MEKLDFKGLSCPQPVLLTKKYLDEKEGVQEVCVLVDNRAASENVLRFLENQGFDAGINGDGNNFEVSGRREGASETLSEISSGEDAVKTLIMINTDRIGFGDDELGLKLMQNFIRTISEMGKSLWRLIFLNGGVKLAVEGSEILGVLQQLEAQGVSILVCGTCLEHYGILEQKKVGETTNMLDVVMSMEVADKVINL